LIYTNGRRKKRRNDPRPKELKQRIHPGIFIIVHIFLGSEKCAIGDAMIQRNVKSIGILGKFLVKKADVMR